MLTSPSIRLATPDDLHDLSFLAQLTYTAAFGDSFDPGDLAAHLRQHLSEQAFAHYLAEDVLLVAEVRTSLIGYAQFGGVEAGSQAFPGVQLSSMDIELRRLYVHPAYQNLGIGGKLMEAALAHPLARRATQIVLDVWEYNTGAQRFYARYGFQVAGQRRFPVASGVETSLDLIMVRQRLANL